MIPTRSDSLILNDQSTSLVVHAVRDRTDDQSVAESTTRMRNILSMRFLIFLGERLLFTDQRRCTAFYAQEKFG